MAANAMNSVEEVEAEMEDKIRHACLKADELIEREISGVKQKWDYLLPKLKIMWTFTQVSGEIAKLKLVKI